MEVGRKGKEKATDDAEGDDENHDDDDSESVLCSQS